MLSHHQQTRSNSPTWQLSSLPPVLHGDWRRWIPCWSQKLHCFQNAYLFCQLRSICFFSSCLTVLQFLQNGMNHCSLITLLDCINNPCVAGLKHTRGVVLTPSFSLENVAAPWWPQWVAATSSSASSRGALGVRGSTCPVSIHQHCQLRRLDREDNLLSSSQMLENRNGDFVNLSLRVVWGSPECSVRTENPSQDADRRLKEWWIETLKGLLMDKGNENKLPPELQGSSNRRAPGSVNAAGKLSQKW